MSETIVCKSKCYQINATIVVSQWNKRNIWLFEYNINCVMEANINKMFLFLFQWCQVWLLHFSLDLKHWLHSLTLLCIISIEACCLKIFFFKKCWITKGNAYSNLGNGNTDFINVGLLKVMGIQSLAVVLLFLQIIME